MSFNTLASIMSFGGKLLKLTHLSSTTGCEMSLNVFLPSKNQTASATTTTTTTTSTPTSSVTTVTSATKHVNSEGRKIPVLFFLSGLTCTGDNCAEKGFLQYAASRNGIAIVYPDTSPRLDEKSSDSDKEHFKCGTGASFYLNATRNPWYKNYQMESYITRKLPKHLFHDFPELDASRVSITGFGMGGHGALTLFLKNPGMYKSVSAFAPMCNPINCEWGKEAFTGYLGTYENNIEQWKMNDATELARRWLKGPFPCLIDVGTSDVNYVDKQLLPENFAEAANMNCVGQDLTIRYQEGYDHSYHIVSSFASDHVNFAAEYLFA